MFLTVLRKIGGLFFRRATTVDAVTGEESTVQKATPFGKGAAWVFGLMLLWHFLLWPILNYHFPHYGFPLLDVSVLSAVLASLGGM